MRKERRGEAGAKKKKRGMKEIKRGKKDGPGERGGAPIIKNVAFNNWDVQGEKVKLCQPRNIEGWVFLVGALFPAF